MSLGTLLGLQPRTQKRTSPNRRVPGQKRKSKNRRGPEPIRLLSRRHNYFPQRFMWRGQKYNIYAVEEAWTEVKRGQRAARHWFRVHCTEGTFDIYQDLSLNSWYMAKQVA